MRLGFLWRIIAFSIVAVTFIQTGQHTRGQSKPHDFGSEMVSLTEQGHFEEAVQVGLRALENQQSDEFVYEQIADVYLIRAKKDPDRKEQWVAKAISYTEKALSLNSKDKDAAGVHLLQDARSFEVAGDLSAGSVRCSYYGRAVKILEDRVPLLRGDHLTVEGKDFPLAPIRVKNEKRLSDVKSKITSAGCK